MAKFTIWKNKEGVGLSVSLSVTVNIGCLSLSNYIQDSKVNEKIKLKNKDLGHKEGVCHKLLTCRGFVYLG